MKHTITLASLVVALMLNSGTAAGQTTQFTHNGNLGFSVSGFYDFELKLYDTPTVGTGTQQGTTDQKLHILVTNGEFVVTPGFGAAVFTGGELFLETWWRVEGSSTFTVLPTREKVTAVYANRSLSAATADAATNSTQLGGLPSSAFIQNTTSQQVGSFNVTGVGTAGGTLSGSAVNAATQYNLGGSRILSNQGYDNLFAGIEAGISNTGGNQNAFFGYRAGYFNTEGHHNSFFGYVSGFRNTTGEANSFFGANSGSVNTEGSNNSFFGEQAGDSNVTGSDNAFFGFASGLSSTGSSNAFFGSGAGEANRAENENTFIGALAGRYTGTLDSGNTGHFNTFVGSNAGAFNTTGSRNTIVGARADFSNMSLTNATAIGANASVGQSNSLVLGSINGVNGATADTNVGIGTTTPTARLHVSGVGVIRARINSDSNGGLALSLNNQPKWSVATVSPGQFQIFNDAIGQNAVLIDSANNNFGIGTSPSFKLHVIDPANTGLRVQTNSAGGTVASFGGNGDFQIDAPGFPGGRLLVKQSGNVGIGTAAPQDKLDVFGILRVQSLGSAGSIQLCRNASNQISTCSSSLRYKTNVAPFAAGLNLVNRLQPITFSWKANGEADLGLGAEDVAKVEPLLVTRNASGEVEGVKYDRMAVVLLNAVKEQQAQIKEQQQQIQRQQKEIEGLKRMVYSQQSRKAAHRAGGSTQGRVVMNR